MQRNHWSGSTGLILFCLDEREISPTHKFYTSLSDEDVEQDEEEVSN